jgi:hypothetical protein
MQQQKNDPKDTEEIAKAIENKSKIGKNKNIVRKNTDTLKIKSKMLETLY